MKAAQNIYNLCRLAVKFYENDGDTLSAYCYTKHMGNGYEQGLIKKPVVLAAFRGYVLQSGVCNFDLWFSHYAGTFVLNNMLTEFINHTEQRVVDYKDVFGTVVCLGAVNVPLVLASY